MYIVCSRCNYKHNKKTYNNICNNCYYYNMNDPVYIKINNTSNIKIKSINKNEPIYIIRDTEYIFRLITHFEYKMIQYNLSYRGMHDFSYFSKFCK